jgi:hypothetical protein
MCASRVPFDERERSWIATIVPLTPGQHVASFDEYDMGYLAIAELLNTGECRCW